MRTALITGGSRGIGAAAVRAFARAGFRAAFFYRADEAAAGAVARETGAAAIRCDVSDPACVREACREAESTLGHIDALVNNAGIAQQKLLTDITDDDWRRMLDVNLSGAFYVTRTVLPGMISRKRGSIVYVSSIWGQVGASCEAHYSAAKAGLIGLTRALAKEVGPSGIRVNCIAPGVIDTEMNGNLTPEVMAQLREETPLGTIGTPKQVADLALYLAGEGASFLTGQVISPNGGFLI